MNHQLTIQRRATERHAGRSLRTPIQIFSPDKAFALLAMCAALGWTSIATAQVEAIDPNPTQPFDIDTDFGYGPTRGNEGMGRGPRRPGQPREENPAETMLREIEGTNYGHHTGHALTATLPGARSENRWRYRFYRGRWWYWTPAKHWDVFDGRRWVAYSAR